MIHVNLLPTKAAQRKESVILQMGLGAAAIAIAAVVCMFINSNVNKKITAEQAKINDLNAKISQLKSIIKQVDDYKAKRRDLNRKIDTIKQLNRQRSGPVKFMEEFTYVIPRKAWITGFKEEGRNLSLEGLAR